MDSDIIRLVAGLPGLLIALVIHEYAHAVVAVKMGDPTPNLMGRLTLNPMAHVDIVGFLMLLIAQFGWAKPVMYNPRNFRKWREGELLVALAGPVANIITGFLAYVVLALFFILNMEITPGIHSVFSLIILYNVGFAVFNMIPLPPLDGSKVLMYFMPSDMAYKFASIERYSFIILILLIMTPILHMIIIPARTGIIFAYSQILSVFV